ncbi:MAG: KEOPS complex subunit Pcc1 [Thermoproteota archaeon]
MPEKMKPFQLKLIIYAEDELMASSILGALQPDNEVTPPDLTVKARRVGRSLLFNIAAAKIDRLLPTFDEILTCYSVSLKSLKCLRR